MISKVHSGAEDGEPAAKKQKTIESETKSVKKEMAFVSLAETLKVRYIYLAIHVLSPKSNHDFRQHFRWTGAASCTRSGFVGWIPASSCSMSSLPSELKWGTTQGLLLGLLVFLIPWPTLSCPKGWGPQETATAERLNTGQAGGAHHQDTR